MSANLSPEKSWGEVDLELVHECPVCGSDHSQIHYSDLVDNAFGVAPGTWTLHKCEACQSGFLSPRPDRKSIHRAYGNYYTHQTGESKKVGASKAGLVRRIYLKFLNGYYNFHHGTHREPQSKLGACLLWLYPKLRRSVAAKFRFLKPANSHQRLLDVGCGNGDFLVLMSEIGWEVQGLEPDSGAVKAAASQGVPVIRGTLEDLADRSEQFDVITMSHVIEHVHDPVDYIARAYDLLKPGGILYVDTPNIDSIGLARFGSNWRGLEMPRHLVLFSGLGLDTLLKNAGFKQLRRVRRSEVRYEIFLKSFRMVLGKSPYDQTVRGIPLREWIWTALPRSIGREEFLTVLAYKP